MIKYVKDKLRSTRPGIIRRFLDVLDTEMETRAQTIFSSKILQMATLLDPRYKYDNEYSKNWGDIEDNLCEYAYERKN